MKTRYKILNGFLIFLVVAITALAFVLGRTADCEPTPAVPGGSETMKAITYNCYGPPDVLQFADVEKPTPADDEVLVKVQAASVNPLDWHFVRGTPYLIRLGSGLSTPGQSIPGVDFAGTVESVGKNVKSFKPGDEVYGRANEAFAEYVTVREGASLVLKPSNMSFEQSAAVPIAGVTAIQALRDYGKLQPGQKVLVNGASGGVGTFAVQVAKAFGAEVTAVCSARNADMVRSLGADHVFDYRKENYTESGQHYDLIIDMISNHSLTANRDVLNPGGRYVIVGGGKGDWVGFMGGPLKAMILSAFVDEEFGMMLAEIHNEDLESLNELMQAGELTPVIDRRFKLSEVADALRYSEEGHARGKIIIYME
jgi:NADPH:quinone reductase-like Zn-dependent oxidoreductase